jgi:hypothetical protein
MSLTDHLVASGSHAGLPFRRDCPVCRAERLTGRLPSNSPAPGRAAAAVLAGTLATGGLAPAAAAAATPGVDQVTGVQSSTGSSVPAVVATAPPLAPTAPGPVASAQAPSVSTPTPPVSAPTPPVSVPTPSVSVPALAPSAPATPQTPAPVPAPTPKPSPAPREPEGGGDTGARTQQGRTVAPQVPAPAAGELSPPPARPGQLPARRTTSGWTYVVRPNDSLWTIAELMLGKRATDAEIARLVDRIWHLNTKRIGTGDPSLIMPGQRLLLPRT